MSNLLTPIITNAGRDAMMQDIGSKQNYRISLVGLGLGDNGKGYVPTPEVTSLKAENQRAAVSAIVQNQGRLHVTAVMGKDGVEAGQSEYQVREIGFYLQMVDENFADKGDPLLFAVYATDPQATEPLLTKDVSTELLLAFDLEFPLDDKTQIPFDHNSFVSIPSATQVFAGTVRLATLEDVKNESATAVVTPSILKQALPSASEAVAGVVRLATQAEASEHTSTDTAVTPKGVADTLSNYGIESITWAPDITTRTSKLEKQDRVPLTGFPGYITGFPGGVSITKDHNGICHIHGTVVLPRSVNILTITLPPGYRYDTNNWLAWPVLYFPRDNAYEAKVAYAFSTGQSLNIHLPGESPKTVDSVICLSTISYIAGNEP